MKLSIARITQLCWRTKD